MWKSTHTRLNPVRGGAATKEEVARQQAKLRDFQWSSYRAMIGIAAKEEWLETKETLSRWGDSMREQQKKYARESTAASRELTAESVESVKKRVARAYKVRVEDLEKTGRGCGRNEARQVAIWLARERCGGQATMREIGQAMGGMTRSGVSTACRRVSFWLKRDKRVKRIVAKLS